MKNPNDPEVEAYITANYTVAFGPVTETAVFKTIENVRGIVDIECRIAYLNNKEYKILRNPLTKEILAIIRNAPTGQFLHTANEITEAYDDIEWEST